MTDETTSEQLAEIEGQGESTPVTGYTPPDGWRVLRFGEQLLPEDVWVNHDGTEQRSAILHWDASAVSGGRCIRRIKPQPEPQPTTDDPSGPGWRDVEPDELLQDGDMLKNNTGLWLRTSVPGRLAREGWGGTYRRRIEPQQASDSEPETMEQLRDEVAALTFELMAERDSGMIALQQLREQVATLTRELKDKSDSYQICLRNHYKAGQRSAIDRLQAWLKPVIELVAQNPDDASPLAVAVLGYLPGIASRLIEE